MNRSMKMLAVGAFALALVPVAGTASSKPVDNQAATKQTITDIRGVGTAMYNWYKDQAKQDGKGGGAPDPVQVDISDVPVISRADLEKLLVPKYISHIPETDGWGNPYEFHLNVEKPNRQTVMGLRSAGRDGVFSGETYEIGGFPLDQFDQDIAWVDGFFVRWPDPKK